MDCKLYYDTIFNEGPASKASSKRLKRVWNLTLQSGYVHRIDWDGISAITPFQRRRTTFADIPFQSIYKTQLAKICISFQGKEGFIQDSFERLAWNLNLHILLEPYGLSFRELDLIAQGNVSPKSVTSRVSILNVSAHYDVVTNHFIDSQNRRCRMISWRDKKMSFTVFVNILRLYDMVKSLDRGCVLEVAEFPSGSPTINRYIETMWIKNSHTHFCVLRIPQQKPTIEFEQLASKLYELTRSTVPGWYIHDMRIAGGYQHLAAYDFTFGPTNWGDRLLHRRSDICFEDEHSLSCKMWHAYSETSSIKHFDNLRLLALHIPSQASVWKAAVFDVFKFRYTPEKDKTDRWFHVYEQIVTDYKRLKRKRRITSIKERIYNRTRYNLQELEELATQHADYHRVVDGLFMESTICPWYDNDFYEFTIDYLKANHEFIEIDK